MSDNYDEYFNNTNSVINNPVRGSGMDFDAQYTIQSRNVKLSGLLKYSNYSTATGAIPNQGAVFGQIVLTPASGMFAPNNGVAGFPLIDIYEGTSVVGSMQIFPQIGSGISPKNKFTCTAGFEYSASTPSSGTPNAIMYAITIFNNSGTTANVFVESQWKFIQNNSSPATTSAP